jgi:hypothetical protein
LLREQGEKEMKKVDMLPLCTPSLFVRIVFIVIPETAFFPLKPGAFQALFYTFVDKSV